MHEGHRKRIMERLKGEGGSLQDHELLEILLFNALPRKNTNPLAHALLDSFGDLRGVLSADVASLMTVTGVGESVAEYLRCVGLLFERTSRKEEKGPSLPSAASLFDFAQYLKERYSGYEVEVIELFCTDSRGVVRASKRYTSFDSGRATVSAEEITKFLVANRPHGLVAAHNHPKCSSKPSAQDDKFTAQLQMCCSMHDVIFRDHVIAGNDGVYSYFLVGRMEDIRRDFSVEKIVTGKRMI